MGKFDLDFTLVQDVLYKDQDKIPISGNEHRMVRVAFDLFRLKDDDNEDLWQVQADDDGEFLVRTYSLPSDEEQITTSEWSIKEDEKRANLTVAYHGIPIQRLAAKDFGAFTPEDTMVLRGVVLRKLANDKNFVFKFFEELSHDKKEILKAAGFLKNLRDWLTSQDITDDIMEKIITTVKDEGPPFRDNCPLEEMDLGRGTQDVDILEIENECEEDVSLNFAALELELQLKTAASPTLPELPPELQFDLSDVDAGSREWESEEMDEKPQDSFLIDNNKMDELMEEDNGDISDIIPPFLNKI